MPIDYKEYPDNWKWLSNQIIKDADNRCELCYAPNGYNVVRDKRDEYPWRIPNEIDMADEVKQTKIVLTVHHIDSDKKNDKKVNLIALCQRCHLRLDLEKHMRKRKKRKGRTEKTLFEDIKNTNKNTACNQNSYAYLTQACATALRYLNKIDLVYDPNEKKRVVKSIKKHIKKAKQAQHNKGGSK